MSCVETASYVISCVINVENRTVNVLVLVQQYKKVLVLVLPIFFKSILTSLASSVQFYWHLFVVMMCKLSNEDKMHDQMLHKQGFGAKVIRASYSDKNWSLSTLQMIRRRVDETGSAVTRRAGSGRSKSVLRQLVNILNTV